jgi:rhodanese-related sulfurtransferase
MLKKVFFSILLFISYLNADFREVTPKELQEMIEYKIPVIDIRTPNEWFETGVIPTSNKIMFFDSRGKYNIKVWEKKLLKVIKNKSTPFVLVCRSGNRTGSVGEFLAFTLDYKNVYHLQEGINSWIEEKREVIKD